MGNVLLKYLEERHKNDKDKKEISESGPVITISREFGCSAKMISKKLSEQLNEINAGKEKQKWKIITKEILESAAKELGLDIDKIDYVFKNEKRGAIDDILNSLSNKYYKSDRKIKQTLKDVILGIGEKGNAIIVGRCGATITRSISKSLHIRLIAPLTWRVPGIKERHEISYYEAEKLAIENDKRRANLRDDFAGKKIDDYDYDLILNAKSLSIDEIVALIIKTLKMKKII
ncbi:MAG: cytidylate kinase-like family protein [Bacteroidota bacterium]|nr:cytidylate kinase-like family protein [Bacteroidota bacterium]